MYILRKSQKKTSTRRQIDIRGVKADVLMLPRNQYRVVLEVSAINFELRSEEEQDALIDTYESFLDSLPCPIQAVIRIRTLDIDQYLADLQTLHEQEAERIYQNQIENYREFVQEMVVDNHILSRRFYVVLPCTASDFETAKEHLSTNIDIVSKGFMRLGIHARQLDNLEILDVFHSFYNPAQAKRQPVSELVAQLLNSSYIRKEAV
ncbi:MAG TPA: TraC family protein [Candidatus Saccharimonadia bacterium]|nr:TraC family protein [Candidatus Saccharimonadia bacterium]